MDYPGWPPLRPALRPLGVFEDTSFQNHCPYPCGLTTVRVSGYLDITAAVVIAASTARCYHRCLYPDLPKRVERMASFRLSSPFMAEMSTYYNLRTSKLIDYQLQVVMFLPCSWFIFKILPTQQCLFTAFGLEFQRKHIR